MIIQLEIPKDLEEDSDYNVLEMMADAFKESKPIC